MKSLPLIPAIFIAITCIGCSIPQPAPEISVPNTEETTANSGNDETVIPQAQEPEEPPE